MLLCQSPRELYASYNIEETEVSVRYGNPAFKLNKTDHKIIIMHFNSKKGLRKYFEAISMKDFNVSD